MKWSREKDFLKRGAFPLLHTENGLSFVPMSPDSALDDQFESIDVLLTKPTDEIVSWENGLFSHVFHGIKFSESFEKVASYLREHPSIFVIDPLEHIVPLMDRFATQDLLESIILKMNTRYQKIRAPQSVKIEAVDQPNFLEVSDVAKLGFPTIVKPQIACGASDAHVMAVVLRKEGYRGLQVPFPAIVQEYIDHGSKIYKFYILGHKLFFSVRRSMPNVADLSSNSPAIVFDSLKSLPVNEKHAEQQSFNGEESTSQLDLEAVECLAAALRTRLGLTIFGFDIVIQEGTNDHVIVDVNYFPSFKDVPDSEAIPAFWNAIIKRSHQ
ncbi:hypothetical protein O6H91_10G094900 [Diphasiastrum complanatum]|nr:hypothetical protein O6H91_10G094900 [Diphasiastrum complanatum]